METMKFGEASPAEGGASQGEENNQAAPKAPRNKKLIWAGIILAALILSVIGWQYWQYTNSVYYQQMKAVKAIEKDLKEQDKWGGKTPEETVRLFTEAIKKGDFDLASKYGNEEKIKPVLEKMRIEGKIDQLINWLAIGELQEIPGFGGDNFDLIVKENSQEVWILGLFRSDGGTWKITEF
ncbi:MAG: hypothetical protein Q7J30_01595 [Candidatus Azambacteria bacterium]|nr:hypothetical protein [Candidatus Azambacteria bacterium]